MTDGPLSGTIDAITIEYDYFGNKQRFMDDPDMGIWLYLYNPIGETAMSGRC